jgi:hypothetical protein
MRRSLQHAGSPSEEAALEEEGEERLFPHLKKQCVTNNCQKSCNEKYRECYTFAASRKSIDVFAPSPAKSAGPVVEAKTAEPSAQTGLVLFFQVGQDIANDSHHRKIAPQKRHAAPAIPNLFIPRS